MLKINYILFISCLLLFISGEAISQNVITGNIRTETGEPLAGANIVITNTTLGTASGNQGNYRLSGLKDGEYTIRVSFFGFETREEKITLSGQEIIRNFIMTETSIDLNAVVVTGTRTEKSLANTPVLTQSINRIELQNKDAVDITQALEFTVPGLEFNSQAQGKSITLQGIDPQYMLFLVDGERIAGETYGDIDYSRINIAGIERIEVVKGASSTLYGSNALGGVVNIITRTPSDKLDLSASARFSAFNTQNFRLSAGSKTGRFSTQTSLMYDKTDGYDLLGGNSYRTQEKEDAIVVSEHLKYSVSDKLLLEANASLMTKNRENTSEDLYDRRNRSFTWGGKGSWFVSSSNSVSLSWNSDNYEILDKITPDDLNSVYDNRYNTARLLGNFRLADWNLFTLGAEYNSENLTASRNEITDKTNTDYILFGQEDIRLGEKANIIGGLRAHNNSQYGWHVTPQLSAMYRIWHLNFRGNYSMGYKTPSLKEKYMSFRIPAPGPPMFLVGFEGLEPETSRYTSFSTEYTRSGVSLSVSIYQNHISNMISENMDEYIVKPGGIIEYAYRNYNEVLLKGADIILRTKVIKNLHFTGALSFSGKFDEVEDRKFNNVRNFNGKFNVEYTWSKGKYDLNANLQSNFYGAKSIDLMDETTYQVQTVELDSFSLWKLTTTHTLAKNYNFRIGIDNLFDFTDKTGGYNNGTPGRTLFVGIGLTL